MSQSPSRFDVSFVNAMVISNVIVTIKIIIFKFCGVNHLWQNFHVIISVALYEQACLSNEISSVVLSHGTIYLVCSSSF